MSECTCIHHSQKPKINPKGFSCARCGNNVNEHPKMCCEIAFQKGWDPCDSKKKWTESETYKELEFPIPESPKTPELIKQKITASEALQLESMYRDEATRINMENANAGKQHWE